MRGIGIIVNEVAFLDHIVPFLQIMGFPLLVCDPYLKELVEIYYPPMEVIVASDYCLDPLLEPYDTYIYTEHYRRATGFFQFGSFYANGFARSIFLFHGNSDKYRDIYWIEQLAGEDIVLVYGQQFFDWIKEKGVASKIGKIIFCGNYRLVFYQKMRHFFKLTISGRTKALYAPTWTSPVLTCDRRRYFSNVLDVYEGLLKALRGVDLYVKLHPYFEKLMPTEAALISQSNFGPPIYPILEEMDFLIGDFSSISYDFLYFQRPIFLFKEKKPWAVSVTLDNLKENVQKSHALSQKEAYEYAFGPHKPLKSLKEEVLNAY